MLTRSLKICSRLRSEEFKPRAQPLVQVMARNLTSAVLQVDKASALSVLPTVQRSIAATTWRQVLTSASRKSTTVYLKKSERLSLSPRRERRLAISGSLSSNTMSLSKSSNEKVTRRRIYSAASMPNCRSSMQLFQINSKYPSLTMFLSHNTT